MMQSGRLPPIEFEFDSSVIKPESYPTLDKIAEILLKTPRIKLVIEGHTDHIGSDAYNDQLSQIRAESAKQYIASKGVPPDSIRTYGYGKRRRVSEGTSAEDMALNRRIEFVFTYREWDAIF